jgi:predicted phosphodiesterase
MLNIQIVSDLHLEFWSSKEKFNFIKPNAPILALLGDICCLGSNNDFNIFKRFINEILPYYEMIIMVSGNHEYYYNPDKSNIPPNYSNTMQGIDEKLKEYFKTTSNKLYYLDNQSIKINHEGQVYLIVGSTLWSWIPENYRKTIINSMNDYKYILNYDNKKIKPLTSDDVSNLHLKSFKYIKTQITKAKKLNYKIIVFTHHKPYLSEKYNPNSLYVAYESDLSSLFDGITLWAYGHTHISDNSFIKKTNFISNPKGYPNQKTKFNNSLIWSAKNTTQNSKVATVLKK